MTILSQLPAVSPDGLARVDVTAGGAAKQRVYICHIFPREVKVTVFAGMVKVRVVQSGRSGGGRRGAIAGFSAASRKRMLEYLARIRNAGKSAFTTLTYPAVYSSEPDAWKRDLDTFLKRLHRLAPNCHAVWRIEPQKRGAPHFHLLIFNHPSTLLRFRKWVRLTWYEVVGSGDEKHLAAGTQTNRIENRRHAMAYAAKYAAKTDDGDERRFVTNDGEVVEFVGKHWGVFNRAAADVSEFGEYELDMSDVVQLRRLVSRWLHAKGNHYAKRLARALPHLGFSVFGLGDECSMPAALGGRRTIMRMLASLDGSGVSSCLV